MVVYSKSEVKFLLRLIISIDQLALSPATIINYLNFTGALRKEPVGQDRCRRCSHVGWSVQNRCLLIHVRSRDWSSAIGKVVGCAAPISSHPITSYPIPSHPPCVFLPYHTTSWDLPSGRLSLAPSGDLSRLALRLLDHVSRVLPDLQSEPHRLNYD